VIGGGVGMGALFGSVSSQAVRESRPVTSESPGLVRRARGQRQRRLGCARLGDLRDRCALSKCGDGLGEAPPGLTTVAQVGGRTFWILRAQLRSNSPELSAT